MIIIPKRTMQLDNRQVVAGKREKVSESEGKLAIKHGWAVLAEAEKLTKAEEKAKAEAEEKAKAEAEEKAKAEAEEKAKAEAEGAK